MVDYSGTFIVIEGADGSGKATQLELLRRHLTEQGHDIVIFDFPRYSEPSSYFVKQYLNGVYGSIDAVGPYTASLFYALDRYAAADQIHTALSEGKIVLANRYVGSSMAHQGTKFRNVEERRGYFIWLDNLEFEMLSIPRPTMSFVLQVTPEIGQTLLDKRAVETGIGRDMHERDGEHLKRAIVVYEDMCQLFPKDFVRIDETRSGKLMTPEAIHSILWQKIVPLLPEKPSLRAAKAPKPTTTTIEADNPYLRKDNHGIYRPTAAGKAFLESVVTNSSGSVYGFTDKLGPMLVAQAMSQRTKRADDLRLLLLEDYADSDNNTQTEKKRENSLSKRLTGLYGVVENASGLLTKKLEHHNISSYLELSSPYTYLDQRDSDDHYAYYVPPELDSQTTAIYQQQMDQLFDKYGELIRRVTAYLGETSAVPLTRRNDAWQTKVRGEACQVAAAVLPIATTTAVGVFTSEEAFETVVMELLSDELPEARNVGRQLLVELRKIAPQFLHSTDSSSIETAVNYRMETQRAIKAIVDSKLIKTYDGNQTTTAQLIEVSPRNELDLLPDMLYEASNLSTRDIRVSINSWQYEQKLEAFNQYLGNRQVRQHLPGRALEKARYNWELVTDYTSFRQLQGYLGADPEWQALSPRYGFDMPKLISEAGAEEIFEDCFELSLKLYSELQEKGYPVEAQYATLLGHKLRFKLTHSAREAFQLHEQPERFNNRAYYELVQLMHEKLAEVHPIIGEAVKFVERQIDTGSGKA